MKNRSLNGRTTFETILILILVSIFLIVGIDRFLQNVTAAKESLLSSELINIRMSVMLYKVLNGKYPESLYNLTTEDYLQPYSSNSVINDKYLKTNAVSESGTPLDPFGNEYGYSSATGEVNCLTKGYEDW